MARQPIVIKRGALMTPTYSAQMVFPAQVRIPLAIAYELGVPRDYMIVNANQPLPEGLVIWLKNDLRYRNWFI